MISAKLKLYFIAALAGSIIIALIGYVYTEKDLPPYPGKVVTQDGQEVTGRQQIIAGQHVWQKYGLMDVGSVWGHGTYRGPDFTAQALHNMGANMREKLARDKFGVSHTELDILSEGAVDAVVIDDIKKNTYRPGDDTLVISDLRASALLENRRFYQTFFTEGDADGPIGPKTITNPQEIDNLSDFFFWTAWAASTIRPGDNHTYTNNWPHDISVGNMASGKSLVWSAISLVAFGVCLGIVIYIYHRFTYNLGHVPFKPEKATLLAAAAISASQRKTAKYFLVVAALFTLQTTMGGFMAHYTIHPGTFYGLDFLADIFPYNWMKSWHLQLAVFWIATAWIGMTLFVSPYVGGREPKLQPLLVDILFVAVVIVVVGSLSGEVLGIKGFFDEGTVAQEGFFKGAWFWFGHQGWEYLELGRFWQILLLTGLVIWLFLVVRALKSHFRAGQDRWGLPHFLTYSAAAVVGFFCFGLLYDPNSHLTIADFWRWWVVHTWVEGSFEFFAAAAIVFVMVNLSLVDLKAGLRTVYFTVSLALFSGIIGVGHHYYWFGEPSFWLALGSTVSALEPVPILLLLSETWHNQKTIAKAGKGFPYRYPLMFLSAAVAWEVLGAGVMGLSITTPIINYYEHGTYLTVNHGHTALFGTYGSLAIGLLLFSMRGLVNEKGWDTRLLSLSFWSTNIGLLTMFVVTLLPVGILQSLDNLNYGFWHARSNDFWKQETIQFLGQVRLIPDTLIILGAVFLLIFMIKAMRHLKPATIAAGALYPAQT
ncbi:MAG TPA: nitric-oxide reductase large subunit [Desulfobulbaceae bacterium]|nr:nitric-oxide reductase large subunit [Desulfobulbaceae bacterium]